MQDAPLTSPVCFIELGPASAIYDTQGPRLVHMQGHLGHYMLHTMSVTAQPCVLGLGPVRIGPINQLHMPDPACRMGPVQVPHAAYAPDWPAPCVSRTLDQLHASCTAQALYCPHVQARASTSCMWCLELVLAQALEAACEVCATGNAHTRLDLQASSNP